jgi:hypothetical protein
VQRSLRTEAGSISGCVVWVIPLRATLSCRPLQEFAGCRELPHVLQMKASQFGSDLHVQLHPILCLALRQEAIRINNCAALLVTRRNLHKRLKLDG